MDCVDRAEFGPNPTHAVDNRQFGLSARNLVRARAEQSFKPVALPRIDAQVVLPLDLDNAVRHPRAVVLRAPFGGVAVALAAVRTRRRESQVVVILRDSPKRQALEPRRPAVPRFGQRHDVFTVKAVARPDVRDRRARVYGVHAGEPSCL